MEVRAKSLVHGHREGPGFPRGCREAFLEEEMLTPPPRPIPSGQFPVAYWEVQSIRSTDASSRTHYSVFLLKQENSNDHLVFSFCLSLCHTHTHTHTHTQSYYYFLSLSQPCPLLSFAQPVPAAWSFCHSTVISDRSVLAGISQQVKMDPIAKRQDSPATGSVRHMRIWSQPAIPVWSLGTLVYIPRAPAKQACLPFSKPSCYTDLPLSPFFSAPQTPTHPLEPTPLSHQPTLGSQLLFPRKEHYFITVVLFYYST